MDLKRMGQSVTRPKRTPHGAVEAASAAQVTLRPFGREVLGTRAPCNELGSATGKKPR